MVANIPARRVGRRTALFGGLAIGLVIDGLTFRLLPRSNVENVKMEHAV